MTPEATPLVQTLLERYGPNLTLRSAGDACGVMRGDDCVADVAALANELGVTEALVREAVGQT